MISFNRPTLLGSELAYIEQAVRNMHTSGDGPFTRQCQQLLQDAIGAKRVLMTTSCTHALEMSAMLLELEPGDEIIVPSFTFVSSANAFVLRGARPIFVDSRPDTLNLDERLVEASITERTRAIVVVHYAGVAGQLDRLLEIAAKANVPLIEDNAHGLFGAYRGRPLGSFGAMATQSFHETKNFNCGEGGALVINDPRFIERAEILREKGTNRSRFFRGQVDKYSWVDLGSSYVLSDLLAAYLLAQLDQRQAVQARRRQIWEYYFSNLTGFAHEHDIRLPIVPAECDQTWHLFYLMVPSLPYRQELIAHLNERGVNSVFHYVPLHLSEMGQRFGGYAGQCPVAERAGDCLLRLPLHNQMTDEDMARVVDGVRSFRPSAAVARPALVDAVST
jgi:dTDP-4-amino-4,6-dideoxygalactose transaminase